MYLKAFPISKLKIDKVFVDDPMMVNAIIQLSHSLGAKVICEGVETEQQLKMLQDLDCDAMQGYLLSKPVDAETFVKLITHQ